MPPGSSDFAERVIGWQAAHGRHGLPWQGSRGREAPVGQNDPYRVWVSEIMLQQTRVATVVPYYERFVERFPAVADLAVASEDDVLALWSGLGYYARARNLHRAAREVVARFGGAFPSRFEDLVTLPGVGRSTAAAIAAFCAGERRAILDGNVRRVLSRHGGIAGDPGAAATRAALWSLAEARLPATGIEAYTQGMMDLGADICSARRPACPVCPVAADCVARLEDRVAELPARRVRGEKPRRRIGMLVVLSHGEVLLEKRPPTGIWGGLWSLPEVAADKPPGDALAQGYGISARSLQPLPPFEHAFTHFTLEVLPWRIEAKRPRIAAEKATVWLPPADLAGAALPSPVRRLLNQLLLPEKAMQHADP